MPTLRSKAEAKERSTKIAASDTERTIHISIGRIDVIAETSQTSSRPATKKAQDGISLEDYLRQKKAGGMG
ncbi:hypothetical protein GRAN_3383 [Granulicella sibirica]|uniref:Uncharacterized protein n=2 Tax=Granulicella sibirica TaxID=2479048 RepID=A0A4Q0T4M7_9BACT|nr:hypothetical protein GRAN_3383 [Granulicella sibirica]